MKPFSLANERHFRTALERTRVRVWALSTALSTTLAIGIGLGVPSTALGEANTARVTPPAAAPPAAVPPAAVPPAAVPPGAVPASRSEKDLAVRGIYVHQLSAQSPKKLRYLIDNALKVGLNTFVVDLWSRNAEYARGIKAIQDAGLKYVPRITIFPDGASPEQVNDRALLEKRWSYIEYALSLGAKDIQLDYIRFSSKNEESPENAGKILEVLRFFRQRIEARGARMQIDIFGEVSYGPSIRIGQDIERFAPELDAVCPMLYPSHFEPYMQTAKAPYRTVHGALTALERQTKNNPIPVYAYIEPFNYRYKMSDAERATYLEAQLEAVLDSRAQGFYVWSVGNYYDILFNLLQQRASQRGAAPGGNAPGGNAPAANSPAPSATPVTASNATPVGVSPYGPPPPPQQIRSSRVD